MILKPVETSPSLKGKM
nr:unnamed protein product [Callosobruchus analis]